MSLLTPSHSAHSTPIPTTPLSPSSDDAVDSVLASEMAHDTASLTSTDVHTDPILLSFARAQTSTPATKSITFKARPAPKSTHAEGLGPKMTKSAALRQGLDWAAISIPKRDKVEEAKSEVPGYKRHSLALHVPSLGPPTIAPRANKSSALRTTQPSTLTPSRVHAPDVSTRVATGQATNKAAYAAHLLSRRQSLALPASLGTPTIAPRGNKSSALRTGGVGSRLNIGSGVVERNGAVERGEMEKVKKDAEKGRRASVGPVKSLGAPAIPPRANRSSILRMPSTPATNTTTASKRASCPPSAFRLPAIPPRPASVASTISNNAGPRQTKSSLLRAGLGAKLAANWI